LARHFYIHGKWRAGKRGGRIVVAVKGRGEEEGGRIVVLEPRRHDVGKRWGRGGNDDSCGRRGCVIVVVVIVVERCGQRPGGEGGRRTTMTTMAGRVVTSCYLSIEGWK
jgi:hypothetical protein